MNHRDTVFSYIHITGNPVTYYSAAIASTGHTLAHAPQSIHTSASMLYCVSPALIALTGHSDSQVPQLIQESLITCAIV